MENLDFYGMFDFAQGDTDIYQYTSAEFTALISGISGTGIAINEKDKFIPTANGLNITIGSGMCFIKGRYGYNNNNKAFTLDAETVSLQRIDRIVLASDVINRIIGLKILKGTASSSPVIPTLNQTEQYYEIPVCSILISNGSSTTLTDERIYTYTPTDVMQVMSAIINGTYPLNNVYA